MEAFFVFGIVFYLFTKYTFPEPPKEPDPDEEFGKAFTKYLKKGIAVRK